jgi:hypothetical protein
VYCASLSDRAVAVKILRVKAVLADNKDFLEESDMMLSLDHPALIKVCSHKSPSLSFFHFSRASRF